MAQLRVSEIIPADRFETFDYLADVRNLPNVLARALEVEVVHAPGELKRGAEAQLTMARFGFTQVVRWQVEDVLRGSTLSFRQVEGIFSAWTHTIRLEELGADQTRVTDLVHYAVPGGFLGTLVDDLVLKADLERILRERLIRVRQHFTQPRPTLKPSAGASSAPADTDPSYQSKEI